MHPLGIHFITKISQCVCLLPGERGVSETWEAPRGGSAGGLRFVLDSGPRAPGGQEWLGPMQGVGSGEGPGTPAASEQTSIHSPVLQGTWGPSAFLPSPKHTPL